MIAEQVRLAALDLVASVRMIRFWLHLGWSDVQRQYRRSFLGPIWISLNTLIFILAFSYFGVLIFKTDLKDFLPYFACGLIAFNFITSIISEGCDTFISAENYLKNGFIPKAGFCVRVVYRNLLYLAHNLVIVFAVMYFFDRFEAIAWLNFFFSLGLVSLVMIPVCFVLGVTCARFRDVPLFIRSVLQTLFFVTPVFWRKDIIPAASQYMLDFNPVYVMMDLLRSPLLGEPHPDGLLSVALNYCFVAIVIFICVLVGARKKISLWI
jgi:lipopolysaccharide transport system permease protein